MLITNIQNIFSLPEIWRDTIFRKIFLQNLEILMKGLVRVVSLCSSDESSDPKDLKILRKAIKEKVMLQIVELVGTLKNTIILEFSS
jgi:hypothetical protein